MTMTAAERFAGFAVDAAVPDTARRRAAQALLDTIGVMLAGSAEPAARAVQEVVAADGAAPAATVCGTALHTSPALAALANGTAAHALDYDDMCFVSLAHPSAPLVPAALAAAEAVDASAARLLDGYVIGFEIEAVLGRTLNPAHYRRGWHCTSTLGAVGSAACAARIFGLDAGQTMRAVAIAASSACGLKENFGTMTKPLHAGLAARSAIAAAQFARAGVTASRAAIDGPQGMLTAMDGSAPTIDPDRLARLGQHWEILDTGVSVKLYPSCAGTHPSLDALLALRQQHGFTADAVATVVARVDTITPTVLIYDRPASGLEGKFSMPFCLAAALVDGRVDLDTFEAARLADPAIQRMLPSITMEVDPEIGRGAEPLTQALVTVTLKDGRTYAGRANGARGYPERPASPDELAAKFLTCARRALPGDRAAALLAALQPLDGAAPVRSLTSLAAAAASSAPSPARARACTP